MEQRTVGDVLGAPESWPDYRYVKHCGIPDMRGAVISSVSECFEGIVITTCGSVCGETYAIFFVADPRLRRRALRALKVGQEVHDAAGRALED